MYFHWTRLGGRAVGIYDGTIISSDVVQRLKAGKMASTSKLLILCGSRVFFTLSNQILCLAREYLHLPSFGANI